jgi:choline dehydrogenase
MPSTYSLVQICLCAILTSVAALTDLKRQISQLMYSYDFIVAGGGTAGLTVADRLSEALPESTKSSESDLIFHIKLITSIETILVIEYGEMEYARGAFDPPDIDFAGGSTARRPASFNYQSLPNMDVNNKTASVLTGKTVGGSSAINGMFFDRPSRFDLDAWAKATSPEFDASDHKWSWEGVFPYYKKVRKLK